MVWGFSFSYINLLPHFVWSHRAIFLNNQAEKNSQLLQQPDIIPSIEEVTSTAKPVVREIRRLPRRLKNLIAQLPHQEVDACFICNFFFNVNI